MNEPTAYIDNPIETMALCIFDLLAAQSDDTLEDACNALCDYISYIGDANLDTTVRATMLAARTIDNNESYHAAHIRDAFRDAGYEV